MAIEIREEVGYSCNFLSDLKESICQNEDQLPYYGISENSIMVDMESIHSILTKNLNYYEPHCLEASVPKWTSPYEKPVIMYHNDKNGVIIGRIKNVKYIKENTRSQTPGLLFTCNIGNKLGIEGVKNGTLATVSIGVIVYDLRCSICGKNLAEEGECEHEKGQKYNDKLCYWIIKDIEPKEVSYVIVPSDKYAHNIKIYDTNLKKSNTITESYKDKEVNKLSIKDLYYDELSKEIALKEEKKLDDSKKDNAKDKEIKNDSNVKDEDTKVNNVEAKDIKSKDTEAKDIKPEDIKDENDETEDTKAKVKNDVEDKKQDKLDTEDKTDNTVKDESTEPEDENKNDLDSSLEQINLLKAKVEDLLSQVSSLKTKLKAEQNLRESSERKLLDIKAKQKLSLAEQINSLRKNLELEEEDINILVESSEDVLNSKIETLKDFSKNINEIINKMPKLNSESLVEQEQDNTAVYDKQKETEKVDPEKLMIEKYNKLIKRY